MVRGCSRTTLVVHWNTNEKTEAKTGIYGLILPQTESPKQLTIGLTVTNGPILNHIVPDQQGWAAHAIRKIVEYPLGQVQVPISVKWQNCAVLEHRCLVSGTLVRNFS